MLPVRCFTCGKVIAALEVPFDRLVDGGRTVREALDELKIVRSCCRTRFITRAEDCTDVPVIDGEFVPGIARIKRQCTTKRWISAR